jgi:endonuclease/exonuclease/phosphatase family metal-dependent hydrolase
MKTTALLLLAAVLGLPAGAAESNSLRVLTWNIHIGRGLDRAYDLDRIARIIREADADLVALQEVDRGARRSQGDDQPAELAKRLPGYTPFFASAMPHDGGEYGGCLLSRLPVRTTRLIALPAAAGHEPRVAGLMEVEYRGRPLVFVGTHLDHQSDAVRETQLRHLLGELPAAGGSPVILAGDFNADATSKPLRALAEGWRVLWTGAAPATHPADAPAIAIDHIWVRPGTWADGARCTVVPEATASDHRPVLGVLAK